MEFFSKRQTRDRVRLILREFAKPQSLKGITVSVRLPITGSFCILPDDAAEFISLVGNEDRFFSPSQIEKAPHGGLCLVGLDERKDMNQLSAEMPREAPNRTAIGWLGMPIPRGRPWSPNDRLERFRPHLWKDNTWILCS
jgi:hypothetical protein|tara:strand:+ start:3737 stop:4156 length:420 start_codon:yes stop_codon:yes gene_type:complete